MEILAIFICLGALFLPDGVSRKCNTYATLQKSFKMISP